MCCNLAIFISLFDYYVYMSANSAWTGTKRQSQKRENSECSRACSIVGWLVCIVHRLPTIFISFSLFSAHTIYWAFGVWHPFRRTISIIFYCHQLNFERIFFSPPHIHIHAIKLDEVLKSSILNHFLLPIKVGNAIFPQNVKNRPWKRNWIRWKLFQSIFSVNSYSAYCFSIEPSIVRWIHPLQRINKLNDLKHIFK